MITGYDYFIIAFYFVFILVIGAAFRRLSKNTSDYFRCGGAMPWWITGTSAWIAGFSAWTFVGAAAKVYETGVKEGGIVMGVTPRNEDDARYFETEWKNNRGEHIYR